MLIFKSKLSQAFSQDKSQNSQVLKQDLFLYAVRVHGQDTVFTFL